MPRRRRKRQQTNTLDTADLPLPKRRRPGEAGPSRQTEKIGREDALLAVQQAFAPRLDKAILKFIKSEAKKKNRLSECEFMEKMEAVKTGLLEGNRVPRGVFDDANQIRQLPPDTISKSIGPDHDVFARWDAYVKQTFQGLLANAWQIYQELSAQAGQKRPSIPVPERIRACGVVFKQIIRQDLPRNHANLFLSRLGEAAARLTDMKADLAAIMRALMLESTAKGYQVAQSTVQINTPNQAATQLAIDQFLPPSMVRHKQCLVDDKYIPVAPLPENLAAIPNRSDFYKLFSDEHVQYVFRRDISAQYTSRLVGNHPIWAKLSVGIPFEVTKLPGLSVTANVAALDLAAKIRTLWNGGIFDYALKRLLLIYYRAKLAPEREQRYRDLVAKRSTDAIAKKRDRQQLSCNTNWQIRRKEKRYGKKCLGRIESADNPVDKAEWLKRYHLSNERLKETARNTDDAVMTEAEKEPSPDNDESTVDADNEEIDPAIMRLLDLELSEDVVRDLAVDGQLGEEEESEAEESEKETSAAKIRQLVAFTKRQLYDSVPLEELLPKLTDGWKGSQSLTAGEINAIQHICSVLKPYMPPKDAKYCIVLRLPIVVISNIVQRVSGYQEFTRSICPIISPTKIHPVSIDAAAIYELMGSNSVGENFTMVDQNNLPISSARWAIANKEATFASFLNLRKIKEECAKNGLVFLDRFIYKADDSVDLIGELDPEVTPAISFYDQRRKITAGGRKQKSSKSLTIPQKELVASLNTKINVLSNTLKTYAINLKHKRAEILDIKARRKGLQAGQERQNLYLQLKEKKSQRNNAQSQVFQVKKQLKEARAKNYQILYAEVHKNSEPIPPPPPTNTRIAHEDDAKHIKIAQLLSEAAADSREIVYSGTDYGICTQSTTIRMTSDRFQAHLKLYNYFEPLSFGQERESDPSMSYDYAQIVGLASPAKEKCHRITSGEIRQMSLGRILTRRRERRKSNSPTVQEAEKKLLTCSTKEANNAADVLRCHKIGQEQRQELRGFYYSKRQKKEHHTAHLLLGRTYDRLASKERQFIAGGSEGKKTPRTILCIGQAGTGVG